MMKSSPKTVSDPAEEDGTKVAKHSPMAAPTKTTLHKKLGRRSRGAIMAEYAVLLTGVAVPSAAGIVAGGAKMLQEYHSARDMLLLPIP